MGVIPIQVDFVLENVIPESVIYIDYKDFRSANIRSITIHNTICAIGGDAWEYCNNP